ncbi:helix-turn-helix domain-containing protein [Halosimplex litoreum]|uniref:Helix-turn-helix domain-containing protein n=1 Tax=Halosimplex litoreum TaxID=1198301 RepID=A0A7U3WB70_9EURY|nr:helix-turn-helix domain-containing protein [Halosimplex litoreum]QPV64865.1 helix-turn-helix domain-containing protein [Halosimplex litoreum]
MRYVTLLVSPTEGQGFHPVGERIARDPDVTGEAIHRMNDLGDGTVTLLTELSGDVDRYREIMTDTPEVREFTVVVDDEGHGWAYSRIETNDLVEYMLARGRDLELVRDMPIELTERGGQRVTLIGTEAAFASAAEFDEPPGYDITVEKTGEYHPEGGRLLDALTSRQREVLEAAVDVGYYEAPREATHEDVAAAAGCSPATAGEHLQKVERAVFGALVG